MYMHIAHHGSQECRYHDLIALLKYSIALLGSVNLSPSHNAAALLNQSSSIPAYASMTLIKFLNGSWRGMQ